MTKVLWLVEALVDLRGTKDYIAQDNPVAARRIVKAIKDGITVRNAFFDRGGTK